MSRCMLVYSDPRPRLKSGGEEDGDDDKIKSFSMRVTKYPSAYSCDTWIPEGTVQWT